MARQLDVNPISDTAQFPPKKGTLQFLQDAWANALSGLIISLVGGYTNGYDPTKAYVLYGCVSTAIGGDGGSVNFSITSGAIFFNGEVFEVGAATFSAPSGQVAIMNIVTTPYGVNADPVTFTDGNQYNVHKIRTIQIINGVSGTGSVGDFSGTHYSIVYTDLNISAINPILNELGIQIGIVAGNAQTALSNEVSRATAAENAVGCNWTQDYAASYITPIGSGSPAVAITGNNSISWVTIPPVGGALGKTMVIAFNFDVAVTNGTVAFLRIAIPNGQTIGPLFQCAVPGIADTDTGICRITAGSGAKYFLVNLINDSYGGSAGLLSGQMTIQIQ